MRPTREPVRMETAPHLPVGRRRELAIVEQALQDASAKAGGLLALEGDPGAGKTELLKEFCRRAKKGPPKASVIVLQPTPERGARSDQDLLDSVFDAVIDRAPGLLRRMSRQSGDLA